MEQARGTFSVKVGKHKTISRVEHPRSAQPPALAAQTVLAHRRHSLLEAGLTERVGTVRTACAPLACAVRPQVAAALTGVPLSYGPKSTF